MARRVHTGPGAVAVVLASCLCIAPGLRAGDRGNGNGNGHQNVNFLDLSGSGDWEYYRSEGLSRGVLNSFNALRQRYSIDLAGSILDYRFSRFNVGLDLFQDNRRNEGVQTDSRSLGYRTDLTFFPNRPFPLRLFARRSTVDTTGLALGDSDRETAAWGAEWNLATRRNRQARVQYDRTAYDLESPVSMQNRRNGGVVELNQRLRRRETHLRYTYHRQKELTQGSEFARHDLQLTDRTRFDNGLILLFSGSQTDSDALFSSGGTDDLTQRRVSVLLDRARRRRVGFNLSLDHIDNSGLFVDSSSRNGRAGLRILLGEYVELSGGLSAGSLESATGSARVVQDSTGASVGLRFHRDWRPASLTAAYSLSLRATEFDSGEERTVTNHAVDLQTRVPAGPVSLYGQVSAKQDENDATGVGYSFDEVVLRTGLETRMGEAFRGRIDVHHRNAVYDTFGFGVQESTETGAEGSLDHDRGGITFGLSTGEGISDYIPDPSGVGVFLPGTDLVQAFDAATLGVHWAPRKRLRIRIRARLEDRVFSTIGRERIVSYRPEVEWRPGAWRFTFGLAGYRRENGTSFEQETVQFRASRRFF